jgi:hypothetical protein
MWKRREKKRSSAPAEAEDKASAPQQSSPEVADAPERPAQPTGRRTPAAAQERTVDFSVEHRPGGADAGVAPEQDEDRLPRQFLDDAPESRADRVGRALDAWAVQVADTDDAPSFLTHMRSGQNVLDLTHSHPSGLAQLLAGRGPTRLSSLVREVGALTDARRRARAIREVAERQAEDVGLTTCHLGIGEACWIPEDGGEPLQAPVLVRPVTLRLSGRAREDVELDLDATVDVNPALLRALRDAGIAIDARALLSTTEGPYGFDPTPVLDSLKALGRPLDGFRVSNALVVGNLMDAAGPLAQDLMTDHPQWVDDPLVAALSGDPEARGELGARTDGADAGTEADPDDIGLPEIDESRMVSALDPDQTEVLRRVLAGQDLAVSTPTSPPSSAHTARASWSSRSAGRTWPRSPRSPVGAASRTWSSTCPRIPPCSAMRRMRCCRACAVPDPSAPRSPPKSRRSSPRPGRSSAGTSRPCTGCNSRGTPRPMRPCPLWPP